jgi:hypothetical protein
MSASASGQKALGARVMPRSECVGGWSKVYGRGIHQEGSVDAHVRRIWARGLGSATTGSVLGQRSAHTGAALPRASDGARSRVRRGS